MTFHPLHSKTFLDHSAHVSTGPRSEPTPFRPYESQVSIEDPSIHERLDRRNSPGVILQHSERARKMGGNRGRLFRHSHASGVRYYRRSYTHAIRNRTSTTLCPISCACLRPVAADSQRPVKAASCSVWNQVSPRHGKTHTTACLYNSEFSLKRPASPSSASFTTYTNMEVIGLRLPPLPLRSVRWYGRFFLSTLH